MLSLNLHRRHLAPTQLAIAAAKTREFYDKRAKERQKRKPADSVPENLPEQNGDSRDEAGKAFGVSGRLVDYASKVLKKGTPELIRAVEQNQIAVSTAAVLAEKLRPVIASVRLPAW